MTARDPAPAAPGPEPNSLLGADEPAEPPAADTPLNDPDSVFEAAPENAASRTMPAAGSESAAPAIPWPSSDVAHAIVAAPAVLEPPTPAPAPVAPANPVPPRLEPATLAPAPVLANPDPPRLEPAGTAPAPPAPPNPVPPPRPALPLSWLASAQGEVPVVPATVLDSAEPGALPSFVDDPYARAARAGSFAPFAAPLADAPTQAYTVEVEPVGPAGPVADDQAGRTRRRGFPLRRLVLAFVLGLLLAGTVAVGALYAYDLQYADRVLPGVHVGSVDVSGLDAAAARERLAQAYASFGQGSVVITLAGATTVIPYSDLHREANLDAMVQEALAVGRSASPIDRILQELRTVSRGVRLQPSVTVDTSVLTDRVAQLVSAAERPGVDATALVTPTGFATTPAQVGQHVEAGSGAAEAAAELTRLDAPSQITINLVATPIMPSVTDDAAAAARSQAEQMAQDVTLADGDERWVIPAATVHGWLSFEMLNGLPHPTVDVKAVLATLKPFATAINRDPVSATMFVNKDGKTFGTTPSTDGRTFNASKTTTAVVNVVRGRATGTTLPGALVQPVLTITRPAFTTEQAVAAAPKMVVISQWITNYQPSDHNGFGINIRLPTAKIDTYVVAPHATFSFWKAVGPVTKELGYQNGGAIIDGHTEPQGAIGGGICSCSTTLFNAALRAGFQMGDRLNHYYYIDRYPLGLDATVFISASGEAQDMSWTNDTDTPVVIRGINGPTYVKFVLYGIPNGRKVTFTTPIVKNYKPAHTITVMTNTLPAGKRNQIEYQVDGEDVWVTRTVKDASGTVIHQETYYSHYAEVTGVIQVGSKNPSPTPPPVTTP